MKRYQMVLKGDTGLITLEPHPDGMWMRYDELDVHPMLAQQKADIQSQQNKITLLRAFLQMQVIQCHSSTPCQSCEALQTLLDATA